MDWKNGSYPYSSCQKINTYKETGIRDGGAYGYKYFTGKRNK